MIAAKITVVNMHPMNKFHTTKSHHFQREQKLKSIIKRKRNSRKLQKWRRINILAAFRQTHKVLSLLENQANQAKVHHLESQVKEKDQEIVQKEKRWFTNLNVVNIILLSNSLISQLGQ